MLSAFVKFLKPANKMILIKLAKKVTTCAFFVTMLSVARAETTNELLYRVVIAYSDYGSSSVTSAMWEERAKVQFPEMKDPNSTMSRFVTAELNVLRKIGSDVLKKPEAVYELAVMTSVITREQNISIDKADIVADKVARNINEFDQLFVTTQREIGSSKKSQTTTIVQSQPAVAPQPEKKVRTLAEWISFIKSDAKFSSLQALLGKPDGKDEAQDSIQRYTTYRWWSKVDVGTTHAEDLKVITVVAHGQPIIVKIENPSSGEEMEFPWSDATIWGRN